MSKPHASPRELTLAPLIVGVLLGVVFGASSVYLVLKVGLTVSASIPVAVISITLFRGLERLGLSPRTILQHNIVQTAGSAGESIAFGIGVTMPAIMILGFDLEMTRVTLVALLGALLGILMMIPMRRALIVEQHGVLKYPEGTACAEVLKAGASPEDLEMLPPDPLRRATGAAPAAGAAAIFGGLAAGGLYKLAMDGFRLWKDTPQALFGAPLAGGAVSAEISPELLGVGYIIGPKISSTMVAGGILSSLVLVPMIHFFGGGSDLILAPGTTPIAQMSAGQIRSAYILYIGAGAVAAGGLISVLQAAPTIFRGLTGGLSAWTQRRVGVPEETLRTDRDLPGVVVAGGVGALLMAILLAPSLHMNILGAALIVMFGFLFVTVSSRLTGEIGSSSNPLSGMTVATLLLTCLIFLAIGWTGSGYYVTALSVGGIVCVAASNAGATSQDLKTGFLVGATPRAQQIAILCGATASALALGPVLMGLNASATVYAPVSSAGWNAPAAEVSRAPRESIRGPQAASDRRVYHVWRKTDDAGGPAGRYLVDDAGRPVWLVDPGINGTINTRPDGSTVTKFVAPKATLMSYIIKGILNQQLPWTLVILGAGVAVVMELCGVPSLPFAVGVYLPLSSSAPIFVGGAMRWLADRRLRAKPRDHPLSEAEITARTDRSPGVLLASGYIAGGALAGILIAFLAGGLSRFDNAVEAWMTAHNPAFSGANADLLSTAPFAVLTLALLIAGYRGANSETTAS